MCVFVCAYFCVCSCVRAYLCVCVCVCVIICMRLYVCAFQLSEMSASLMSPSSSGLSTLTPSSTCPSLVEGHYDIRYVTFRLSTVTPYSHFICPRLAPGQIVGANEFVLFVDRTLREHREYFENVERVFFPVLQTHWAQLWRFHPRPGPLQSCGQEEDPG